VGLPRVTFIVPVFNGADRLRMAVTSALRQVQVDARVLVVMHGPQDETPAVANALSREDSRVAVLSVERRADDRRTPARPLNAGLREVLRSAETLDQHWALRLDADDVLASDSAVASQLAAGSYRPMVTATAVHFNPVARYAYSAGPHPAQRTLAQLKRRGAYCIAHPSIAMRLDLLRRLAATRDRLLDEQLEYGEDLMLTCALLRHVADDEFAFVDAPYCLKELSDDSATSNLPLKRVCAAHLRLIRENAEVRPYAAFRGVTELAVARVIGERTARERLHKSLGFCGWLGDIDYFVVARRLDELRDTLL
jgi:glycosyltransferase involved in cell wall biosynthesis